MAIKVVIADDHALLREGLAKILSLESNFLIVGRPIVEMKQLL